ncbi:polyisoprenoid diphosphate/phosphate phosphohydrolase PLPP6 [Magallana gigas]|uniref:Phosphatidic acid phosphatase type 2/haloperoxidase domain-containing protein n=1 Tax=Magallana gigas TaxID=29159 RepID=A0A8W8L8P5_MAGGI|nr:phospholipid phosphatase 6-like [Crassostrea gigas]|eukprot:XP_011422413.1 PREDICTED: phospholipid phosphatase 6-like [Crassostrea gigas]
MSAIQRRKRRPNGGHRKDTPDVKIMKSMDSFARSISSIDYQLTQKCSICARPNSQLGSLRPVMKVLEISCHGIPWLLGTIGLLLSVHKPEHLVVLMNLLIGLIGDLIIIAVLKMLVQRERPPLNKSDMFATVSVDNYSFPSGHCSRAIMLAYFFSERVNFEAPILGLIVLWALLVSLSRLLLGRHYLSDVLFGMILGALEFKLLSYYWLSKENCMFVLEPFFAHFHL